MLTTCFVTATILCLWLYHQTRIAAKGIRRNRRNVKNPLK